MPKPKIKRASLFDSSEALAILAAKYVEMVAGEPDIVKWSRKQLWQTDTMYKGMVRTYGMGNTDEAIEKALEIRRMVLGTSSVAPIPW